MSYKNAALSLSAALLLAVIEGAAAEESALMLKVGGFQLSHDAQTIDSAPRAFDDSADDVYGIAWEARHNDGAAFGVEFFRFTNDWVGPGNARGDSHARGLMFTMKKYMLPSGNIYPFIGAGVGALHATVGGLDFDPALGLALQLVGGAEIRFDSVGLYAELKGLYAEPGNVWGDDINLSGIGLSGGLSILF